MKRYASLLLALMLILVFSAAAGADYTDTAALNSAEQAALKELSDMGVINGYPDGTFRPAANVTRAEFAKMLCVYAGQNELKAAIAPFSDVVPLDWFFGWVSRSAEKGWINGYPGGTFRPQNSVTQQEIATVLVRLSGVNTEGFIWPDDYIKVAQTVGAFKDIVFVGAAPANRIVTCQMFYNMLPPPDTEPAPITPTTTVRGVVTELAEGSVVIKDGKGASVTYTVGANLLPDKLIVGSYLELAVSGQAVVRVAESILPKKGVFVWDVALDGTSAVIDNMKYDLTEADIFTVEYTLNKTYSSETFIKGGPIDRDMLSLGGKLAAEMAVVVESDDDSLITAYLVNPSIIVTGGRLDVVDGNYSNSKGTGVYFLGRDAGLAMELSSSSFGQGIPAQGLFIHYTLRDGVINTWRTILDIDGGFIEDTSDVLKNAGENDPYAWIADTGQTDKNPGWANAKVQVINVGSGGRTLQLGSGAVGYWLADGCLVYEVSAGGKISQGSRGSIEREQDVIALVSRSGDICYIFCFMD